MPTAILERERAVTDWKQRHGSHGFHIFQCPQSAGVNPHAARPVCPATTPLEIQPTEGEKGQEAGEMRGGGVRVLHHMRARVLKLNLRIRK